MSRTAELAAQLRTRVARHSLHNDAYSALCKPDPVERTTHPLDFPPEYASMPSVEWKRPDWDDIEPKEPIRFAGEHMRARPRVKQPTRFWPIVATVTALLFLPALIMALM